MGKLQCRCGYLMSNSSDTNNVELNVFTNRGFDNALGCDAEAYLENVHYLWWCPNCQRIYFPQGEKGMRVWALEKEAPPDAETADEYTEVKREFPDAVDDK